jgi:hypothetical protein
MIKETLLTLAILQTCPGTDYRYCGDKTPETYTQFVWHHGNHDDGSNRTSPVRELPSVPTPPVDRPEFCE